MTYNFNNFGEKRFDDKLLYQTVKKIVPSGTKKLP